MDLCIEVDNPRADDMHALLERHLSFARMATPPGFVYALDAEARLDPAVTYFSARRDGLLLGVGAIKELDPSHGELKSMHISQSARRQGVGRAMLEHLLLVAAERRYRRVSIETGATEIFAPARAFYADAGFKTCAPFADYTANAFSTCMTIELDDVAAMGEAG